MSHSSTAHPSQHRSSQTPYGATFATSTQVFNSPVSAYNQQLYSPPTTLQQFQADDVKPMFAGYSPNDSQLRQQLQQLQHQVELLTAERQQLYRQLSASGQPAHPEYLKPQFHEGWHRRTDARTKLICASNRAGNALCAWHDSRRERRAYPPRMAPAGTLNCGCTEEEALFEESLARNGVGSYRPSGDQVRMDPGLRRPLLDLLKRRYGYRDGDFEINPMTGTWSDGESHREWEERLRTSRRP